MYAYPYSTDYYHWKVFKLILQVESGFYFCTSCKLNEYCVVVTYLYQKVMRNYWIEKEIWAWPQFEPALLLAKYGTLHSHTITTEYSIVFGILLKTCPHWRPRFHGNYFKMFAGTANLPWVFLPRLIAAHFCRGYLPWLLCL